eukprot:1488650-Rhodomonas_salina.1
MCRCIERDRLRTEEERGGQTWRGECEACGRTPSARAPARESERASERASERESQTHTHTPDKRGGE